MKQAKPEGTTHPHALLDLWAGRPEDAPLSRRDHAPIGVVIAFAFVAVIALILLMKYAVDVLLIVLALVALGLVLHVVGIRLAESNILSPAWLLIILLGLALFGYAYMVPAESVAGLGRYMPKWMISALEWSESRGWGQRALIGPGGGTGQPTTIEPATPTQPVATSSPSESSAPGGQLAVALTASSSSSLRGQPVTFMARVSDGLEGQRSVRFYDGASVLGTANVRREGQARIAYLTVTGLSAGQHEIRAELTYAIGSALVLSSPLRHTVRAR